jgi:hypothetical protein
VTDPASGNRLDSHKTLLRGMRMSNFGACSGSLNMAVLKKKKKNLWLSGLFSLLLPGLGHVYVGQKWTGIFYFVLGFPFYILSYCLIPIIILYVLGENPIVSFGCKSEAFLFLGPLVYGGAIFGALRGAMKYNKQNF